MLIKENPKISIIIPCYNVEDYLEQCLESIINQAYRNIEIICINDGSKDGTLDILKKYQMQDSRIIVVDQINKGLSESRNVGVEVSTAAWITFVDSDDWLDPILIKETFQEKFQADLYCCSYNRVFKSKVLPRILNISGIQPSDIVQKRLVGLTDLELTDPSQADSLVTAWAKIYRSELIKNNQIKFLDTKKIGTEDAIFNIQYLNYAKKVFVLDKPLYFYRRSNINSLTSNYKPNLFNQWKLLYSLIEIEIEDKGQEFVTALNNRKCLGILGLSLNELSSRHSKFEKYNKIKKILSDPIYQKSFENFDMHNMPRHWKLFYGFAKKGSALAIYSLATVIQAIQRNKNA